jgi:hypothetical protein
LKKECILNFLVSYVEKFNWGSFLVSSKSVSHRKGLHVVEVRAIVRRGGGGYEGAWGSEKRREREIVNNLLLLAPWNQNLNKGFS